MDNGAYICAVCDETMNRDARQPVSLGCGHTFCRRCLIRIYVDQEHLRCPTCRRRHRGQRPEELPLNSSLLSAMEANDLNRNENSESGSEGNTPGNTNKNPWKRRLIGAAVGGTALVVGAPLVLFGMGFTPAGIAAYSLAAKMMSMSAIANGGGVVAGGVVATLQSIGVLGFGATWNAALAGVGAAAGGYAANKLGGSAGGNGPSGNNNNDHSEGGDSSPSDGPRE